jgi:Na+/melibiose symporter-like transporter
MKTGNEEKLKIFKYVLFTFIAFIIIDTVIRFYFIYFINFELNPITIALLSIPYIALLIIIVLYYRTSQKLSKDHRDFIKAQVRRGGLPVRRKINVTRIKKKLKEMDES